MELDHWVWGENPAPETHPLLKAGSVTSPELALDHDLGDDDRAGAGCDVLV